jgi:hypothetical protein
MTQLNTGPGLPPRRPAPSSNIYTVLVVVAFVALVAGIATMVVRNNQLFGTYNVFNVEPKTATAGR